MKAKNISRSRMWRSIKSGSKVAYNVLCLATVLAIAVAPSFFGVARVAFTVVGIVLLYNLVRFLVGCLRKQKRGVNHDGYTSCNTSIPIYRSRRPACTTR